MMYLIRYVGGPSDGRTDRRDMSREEFFAVLERIKPDSLTCTLEEHVKAGHYVPTKYDEGGFYYEWCDAA
ncbi:MAG: hypothetical protein M3247_04410 [Thermoproteota archaeon]|nr:hypothetical protein [Acidobacteriota bacterium]MDQ3902885.1 hypothetical protein [Thermoproteota archaeon]